MYRNAEPHVGGMTYSHTTTFKTAWDKVAQALWKRYPNPYSQHVLSEDTISRTVKEGKLVSKRLLTKTNRIPWWLEKFVAQGSAACIIEESEVDAAAKTFRTHTRNVSHSRLLSVEESCFFYVSPENNDWTCCEKQAWIKCGVRGFSRAVEKFGADRYKGNAHKAEMGLEFVINKLFPASSS